MVAALYFINATTLLIEKLTGSSIDCLLAGDVASKDQWTYSEAKYLFFSKNLEVRST